VVQRCAAQCEPTQLDDLLAAVESYFHGSPSIKSTDREPEDESYGPCKPA
jgi:hypothetical protein